MAGVAFVLQTWVAALLSPDAPGGARRRSGAAGHRVLRIARAAIGGWMATVLAITKAVGPAFAAMTGQAAAARLLFGMARDGRLPRALARWTRSAACRARRCSRGRATLGVSVWAARRSDGLAVLVSIVDVGALGAFMLLHASVVGYFCRRAAPGAVRAPARADDRGRRHAMGPD